LARAGLAAVKRGYTDGTRRLASRSIGGLARTRVSPNALTAAGITLCGAAAVLVWFGDHNQWLIYWSAAIVFVVGSVLDILDGALARLSDRATPFGAFVDSISDRVSEGFMLTAIGLVFSRHGNEVALAFAFVALSGSFLVSYARAKAELLGLKGDVGFGSRSDLRALGRAAVRDLLPCRHGLAHGPPACAERASPAPATSLASTLLALLC
jgi:phosphatidylglycerophosphate synthase